MNTSDCSPCTLINTILWSSRSIRNGRGHRDVVMHALSEIGELAVEVEIALGRAGKKEPGEDGIAGEALDIILCVTDFAYLIDPTIDDLRLKGATASRQADKSLVQAFLDSAHAKKPVRSDQLCDFVLSIGSDIGELCQVNTVLDGDDTRPIMWAAKRVIDDCLHLMITELPGLTEADMISMADRKLEKWRSYAGRAV